MAEHVETDVCVIGGGAGGLDYPELVFTILKKLKIKSIAELVLPYPTLGEINQRVAGSCYTPSLFGDRMKGLVRFLLSLG